MSAHEIIEALDLPFGAKVERRIPKKLLLESGAPTPADKRHINDGIEEFFWIAVLKPTTIGVPEYRDADREYLEIAVLRVILRAGAKAKRLVELVHRAVPYPVLLLAECGGCVDLSVANKRWAHNEAEKTVIDGELLAAEWESGNKTVHLDEFISALALERQSRLNMFSLYQGWINAVIAFNAALLTGTFRLSEDQEQSEARQKLFRECIRLEKERARLRAAAGREKQMARKVEINMKLKRIEAAHASVRAKL